MAEKKKRAEGWITFTVNRFLPQYWTDIKTGRLGPQLIGVLLAVLILAAQVNFGVIGASGIHARLLSIAWPYAILIAVFVIYHAVRTPWLISNDQIDAVEALNKTIAERDATIEQQHEAIRASRENPPRNAADQYHYERARAFLDKRGPKFAAALQHLHTHGDLTYSSMGITMQTTWPKGIDRNEAISIYDACMAEGLVTMQEISGIHPARKIFIAPAMASVLSELLYEPRTLTGLADIRHT
jgi:hypothetical protein